MKKYRNSWVPVARACNSSYSGGRVHEDRSSKPVQANSSLDPILKKTHHKKGLVEWLKVKALSLNSSTAKKKKNGFYVRKILELM
jgi:hypothetical protein